MLSRLNGRHFFRWVFKSTLLFMVITYSTGLSAQSIQEEGVDESNALIIGASLNNYFFEDDYIFNPIVTGDAGTLHLEGRYNYEDINTLSLFGGYNITVGNKLLWEVTPMIGVAFGETNGFIPAIESTLSYGAFEWYAETEYVVITDEGGDDYFYTWTELNYYPLDWLSLGLIGTRTRLYETDLELQYGISFGYHKGNFSVLASPMNLGTGDTYFYLSVSMAFD